MTTVDIPVKRGRGRPRIVGRTHMTCPRCQLQLPVGDFYSNGLCKPCDHRRQRERRARPPLTVNSCCS